MPGASVPAMTTTRSPLPILSDSPVPDHRPSLRTRALVLTAGGVLFAVGNALHPLEHDDAAPHAATWVAAHVVFAVGAILIAAGMTALTRRFAVSKVGLVGLGVSWLGLVLIPAGALLEAYVRPLMDHHGFADIESATLGFTMIAGFSNLIGPALMTVAAVRHRLFPRLVSLSFAGLTLGALLVPALPKEGYGIIPGTVLFGLGIAAAGWLSRDAVG